MSISSVKDYCHTNLRSFKSRIALGASISLGTLNKKVAISTKCGKCDKG